MSPTIDTLAPWLSEPNHEEWTDGTTGYRCMIDRHPMFLHLCGYVAVPFGHPAFGKGDGDLDVEVHGGITFADIRTPLNSVTSATAWRHHLVARWIDQGGVAQWWIGFDCSHAWDLAPGLEMFVQKSIRTMERARGGPLSPHLRDALEQVDPDQTYRDWDYVRSEVLSLAQQLKNLA